MMFLALPFLASCGAFVTSSPEGNTAGVWIGGELAFAGPGGVELEADAEQSFRDVAIAGTYAYGLNRVATVYNNLIDSDRIKTLGLAREQTRSQLIDAHTQRLTIREETKRILHGQSTGLEALRITTEAAAQ